MREPTVVPDLLPYTSANGVTVEIVNGRIVVDGVEHDPAEALDLSIAIARAVHQLAADTCRGVR